MTSLIAVEKSKENRIWNEVETSDQLKYKFFPVDQIGKVAFVKIKAAYDACVLLTSNLQEAGHFYEFQIGCFNNTKSIITKNRSKSDKVEVQSPGILNSNNYNDFSISWTFGEVTLHYGENYKNTLTLRDPIPIPVCFIGICTKGTTGSWKVGDLKTYGQNIDSVVYQYFPVSNNIFEFSTGSSLAYVALASNPEEPVIEVIIGAGKNSTYIKKNKTLKCNGRSPPVLKDQAYRNFWIRWNNGQITVGHDDEKEPILNWNDPKPFPILYVGVASNTTADWRFKAIPAKPDSVAPSLRLGTWVDASNGLLPPGSVEGGKDHFWGPLYVARANINQCMVPGELMPSYGKISMPWIEKWQQKTDYQVLIRNPSNRWISTSFKHIPAGACPGGINKDGKTLYIGRVHLDNGVIAIGRVPESDGHCYITVDGQEIRASRYEILMY